MKYEELPKEIKIKIDLLKIGDKKIYEDVLSTLESSDGLKDFRLKIVKYFYKIVEERVQACGS